MFVGKNRCEHDVFSGNPIAELPNKRFASRTGDMKLPAPFDAAGLSVYQSFLTPEQVRSYRAALFPLPQ